MKPVLVLVDQELDDLLEEMMVREGSNKSELIIKYLSVGISTKNDSDPKGPIFSKF